MATKTLTLPTMYAKQHDAIFSAARIACIEAGTKTGKTLGCGIWEAKGAWEDQSASPGAVSWWVAPSYKQAAIGWRIMKSLLPNAYWSGRENDLTLTGHKGTKIECRSGEKPDLLFGEGVKRVVVDEASRLREDAWHAIRTTLTQTKGEIRLIGNPKGKRNWFWRLCQKAKAGDDANLSYHHLRSVDNPYNDPAEIEEARKLLPEAVFDELYNGVAQDDGAGVFRNVRACVESEPPEPGRLGVPSWVAGLDLARLQDWTVLTIMDRNTKRVHFTDRFHQLDWDFQVSRIKADLEKFNARMPVRTDATGVGDPILRQLQVAGVNAKGYKYTNESKKRLVHQLMLAFEKNEIIIPDWDIMINELESFEYTMNSSGSVTYNAPPGMHDDCVNSLALANWEARQPAWETVAFN